MTRLRIIGAAVLLAAALFALLGGEYSTREWLSLRRAERAERARIAALEQELDSLRRLARDIESNPETQERIARERHGMLKRGEHAFILEPAPQSRR